MAALSLIEYAVGIILIAMVCRQCKGDAALHDVTTMLRDAIDNKDVRTLAAVYPVFLTNIIKRDKKSDDAAVMKEARDVLALIDTCELPYPDDKITNEKWRDAVQSLADYAFKTFGFAKSEVIFNTDLRELFEKLLKLLSYKIYSENKIITLVHRIAHRYTVYKSYDFEYDLETSILIVKIDLRLDEPHVTKVAVDVVRMEKESINAVLDDIKDSVELSYVISKHITDFVNSIQEVYRKGEFPTVIKSMQNMRRRLKQLADYANDAFRVETLAIENFALFTINERENLAKLELLEVANAINGYLLPIHQRDSINETRNKLILMRGNVKVLLIKLIAFEEKKTSPDEILLRKSIAYLYICWTNVLLEVKRHITLEKAFNYSYQIDPTILALVIEMDLLILTARLPLSREALMAFEHQDILKRCYRSLRDWRNRPLNEIPQPLRNISLSEILENFRNEMSSSQSASRVIWVYRYWVRNRDGWTGFEIEVTLSRENRHAIVELIFSHFGERPASTIDILSDFERFLVIDFLRVFVIDNTAHPIIKKYLAAGIETRASFFKSLGGESTCVTIRSSFCKQKLPFRITAYRSKYTMEEMLKIAQLDMSMNWCPAEIAKAIRASYMGSITVQLAVSALQKRSKEPFADDEKSLRKGISAAIELNEDFPAHTEFVRKMELYSFQYIVVHHFAVYPVDMKHSVKKLKRIIELNARMDMNYIEQKNSVRGLDMNFHLLMIRILDQFANAVDVQELRQTLENPAQFEIIAKMAEDMKVCVKNANGIIKIRNQLMDTKIIIDNDLREQRHFKVLEHVMSQAEPKSLDSMAKYGKITSKYMEQNERDFDQELFKEFVKDEKEQSEKLIKYQNGFMEQVRSKITRLAVLLQRLVRSQRVAVKRWKRNLQIPPGPLKYLRRIGTAFLKIIDALGGHRTTMMLDIKRYMIELPHFITVTEDLPGKDTVKRLE